MFFPPPSYDSGIESSDSYTSPPCTPFMSMMYPSYHTALSVEPPSSPSDSVDSLGLQGLIRNTYAPSIQGELERLFVRPEDHPRPPRARLGSASSSSSGDSGVWDEFQANGRTGDLDELDRIMRKLEIDSESLEGGRATEVLSKAKLLEILRIRERERRRGNRGSAGDKSGVVCVFCRNNGESEAIYSSHKLKDPEGHITCPILYIYTCPICGAKGENAHTIKYCPKNDGDASVNIKALKTKRTSCGRRRLP